MSFVLPTFNLTVSGWRRLGNGRTYAAPDFSVTGNLSVGRRVMIAGSPWTTTYGELTITAAIPVELLLPAFTDIRAAWNAQLEDLVEVPAGTKRFYRVVQVDDIGKGFANEHRIAWIGQFLSAETKLTGGPFNVPEPYP
jgi:hypothetical protein